MHFKIMLKNILHRNVGPSRVREETGVVKVEGAVPSQVSRQKEVFAPLPTETVVQER